VPKELINGRKAVALCGLIRRRFVLVPTLTGWCALSVVVLIMLLLGAARLYPFLGVTERVPAQILVVEGFVDDAGLLGILNECERHQYQAILTTGGPVDEGSHLAQFGSTAVVTALSLKALGVKVDTLEAIPSRAVPRNRTYEAGLGLRKWLDTHQVRGPAINVFSVGPHARRSRLLYEHALGPDCRVGIIAWTDPTYDPAHWWRYDQGVRNVLSEAFAFLYACLTLWTL
jgi:hypothetical protein